jgi:hypothetical protein
MFNYPLIMAYEFDKEKNYAIQAAYTEYLEPFDAMNPEFFGKTVKPEILSAQALTQYMQENKIRLWRACMPNVTMSIT